MEAPKTEPTINDVMQAAEVAKQQIRAEGSFDSEFNDLDAILQKATRSEITPQEALEQIQDLLNSRQNYH